MASDTNERIIGEFAARKNDGILEYRQVHHNPWLDGDYDDIDFRKEINDIGNCGMEKPVGKERLD